MKPKDIQVGKHYIHPTFPGCTWIGAGKRSDPWSQDFTDKHLVLIENKESASDAGSVFRLPAENEQGELQDIWDRFYKKPTDKTFNDSLDELEKERKSAQEKLDAVDRKILETVMVVYNEIASNRLATEDMIQTLMQHLSFPNNILQSIHQDQFYRGTKL